MKNQKTRDKAIELYINNLSLEKIAENLNLSVSTIKEWKKKFDWDNIREKTIQKISEKQPDKYSEIISQQMEIGLLAQKELLNRLKKEYPDIKENDLINIMKHSLEVVRPKTVSQYNFMKQENNTIIKNPEAVQEAILQLKGLQDDR